nr:hypothetical protein [Tanacetum cinerariifolium]
VDVGGGGGGVTWDPEALGAPEAPDGPAGGGGGDERIDQAGSGVVGRSSSKGFHQPCLKFTVGIWALLMFSSSDNCACSSGPIASSMSRSARVKDISGLSMTSGVVQA